MIRSFRTALPYSVWLFVALLFFVLHAVPADTAPEPEYHMRTDLNTLSSFPPRTVGSTGEKRSFDYIRSELRKAEVSFTNRDFSTGSTLHSFSGAVDAVFPGEGGDELYFIVPVSRPPDAEPGFDGSAGIALGLSLCRRLAEEALPFSVHVLFLGADFGGSSDYSRGSRAFLQQFYTPGRAAFIYLNVPALPSGTELLPASTAHVSPYWLLDAVASGLRNEEEAFELDFIRTQLYRLGLNDAPSPIHPYFEAGYPALYLSASPSAAETERAGIARLERISAALLHSLRSLGSALPQSWDRHYQYLNLPQRSLRITQKEYVLGLLLLFALVLIYPFLRASRFTKYGRSIIRNAGALPLLYLLMFLYLYLGTLLLEGVTRFQSYPLWWQERPLPFLILKLAAAGFLFFLSHKLVHMVRFTRLRGSFYSASALVFFLLDIIILSAIDLSLSLYGAITFLFAFLFSITAKRFVKLFFLLLTLIATAIPVYLLFESGMLTAIRPLLLSRSTGNLLLAFHFLPFMLLIIRVRILFHHPNPRITRRIILGFDLLFGALSLLFLSILLFATPFGPENPQPVEMRERLTGNGDSRLIELRSPAPLGSFRIERGEARIDVQAPGARYFGMRLRDREQLLHTDVSGELFLNRALYTLHVTPLYAPQWLRVRLSSPEELVIYESRFPFQYGPDRTSARFDIGRNPPVPLEVRFTLPADFIGEVEVEAEYEISPYPLRSSGKAVKIDYRLNALRRLHLRGERR